MKTMQKGFTLIELMIVVAIIGILAAIAIPAYQDYTIKAQVAEGPNMAAGVKTAVAEYYATNGAFPAATITTAAPAGLGFAQAPNGKYEIIDLKANGVISITYGGQGNAKITAAGQNELDLIPALSTNGDLIWICGNASQANLGGATVSAGGTTTVLTKYLPASCK